eukprot:352398-Chlamydomonas_euryale.AAC.7
MPATAGHTATFSSVTRSSLQTRRWSVPGYHAHADGLEAYTEHLLSGPRNGHGVCVGRGGATGRKRGGCRDMACASSGCGRNRGPGVLPVMTSGGWGGRRIKRHSVHAGRRRNREMWLQATLQGPGACAGRRGMEMMAKGSERDEGCTRTLGTLGTLRGCRVPSGNEDEGVEFQVGMKTRVSGSKQDEDEGKEFQAGMKARS